MAHTAPHAAIESNPAWRTHLEATHDIPEATPADLEWHILELLISFPAAKTSILQRFPRKTLINSCS
jgi:hypothetical protein